MRISIPSSIPHFGTTFSTTRTMYHFDTNLGITPFTTSVDRYLTLIEVDWWGILDLMTYTHQIYFGYLVNFQPYCFSGTKSYFFKIVNILLNFQNFLFALQILLQLDIPDLVM